MKLYTVIIAVVFLGGLARGAEQDATAEHYPRAFDTPIPRSDLPPGSVEFSRDLPAPKWSAPYCKQWTDDCSECGAGGLELEIECRQLAAGACIPSRVRCFEIDYSIAPLYCEAVTSQCDESTWSLDENGLTSANGTALCNKRGVATTPKVADYAKFLEDQRRKEDYKCKRIRSEEQYMMDCMEDGSTKNVCLEFLPRYRLPARLRARLKTIVNESLDLQR